MLVSPTELLRGTLALSLSGGPAALRSSTALNPNPKLHIYKADLCKQGWGGWMGGGVVGSNPGNNGVRSQVLTVQFARLRTVEVAVASPQLRLCQELLTFNYQQPDEMRESAFPPITPDRGWGGVGGVNGSTGVQEEAGSK